MVPPDVLGVGLISAAYLPQAFVAAAGLGAVTILYHWAAGTRMY